MKELKCHKCSCFLGCIEKGKIKNGAVIFCKDCFEKNKTIDDLNSYQNKTTNYDMPDFMQDLFKKK